MPIEPDPDLLAAMAEIDTSEVPPPFTPQQEDLADSFPNEMYEDLVGLMWVGYLSRVFDYVGHAFRIKTLTIGEELAVAQVVKDYTDTMGAEKAVAAAIVAACIETVDNRPLLGRLGPSAVSTIRDKFEFITNVDEGWYWPTIEACYTNYVELQLRQAKVYERLQEKSQANRTPSYASAGSLRGETD